jgi:hypothetical protein
MFNLDQFIEKCQGKPALVVKDLLAEALRDPASVREALDVVASGKEIGIPKPGTGQHRRGS